MIINQLKENIIQEWLLYVQVLQVSFRFQYQLVNLVWLSFHFLSFTEASLSAFLWLYAIVCAVIQKYYELSLVYNYSYF